MLAHELERTTRDLPLTPDAVFKAVATVHKRVKRLVRGGRADRRPRPAGVPRSLRHPAAVLRRDDGADGRDVMVASESVALEGTGHKLERDVAPGEAVFIDLEGHVHTAPVRRARRA